MVTFSIYYATAQTFAIHLILFCDPPPTVDRDPKFEKHFVIIDFYVLNCLILGPRIDIRELMSH